MVGIARARGAFQLIHRYREEGSLTNIIVYNEAHAKSRFALAWNVLEKQSFLH